MMRAMFAGAWQRPGPFARIGGVADRTVPGPAGEIPVRVYTPEGEGPFPVFVWFHGGGWVIGALDDNNAMCHEICHRTNAVVVSVDYRLAPENRFPAAPDDCYAVTSWLAEHGAEINVDGTRIAVGGESAGGNLAAVVSLMARDRKGPKILLQLLVSPVTGAPSDGRASYEEFADGYFQSRDSMIDFFKLYPRDDEDLQNPYLLPLAADDLTDLPPALVLLGECEVLRDEGEEYAHRLGASGTPTELVRYDGQIHGFFGLLDDKFEIAAVAHEHAAAALTKAFATR
ncbi:alpha/beta hydrolase [Catenulispora yoronensis]